MEAKSRSGSGSGIGRIFSLSLNQAISSNSRSPLGFDKSSKLLLLDVEKVNSEGKPGKAPEIVTATSLEQTAGRTPDGQLSDTDVSRPGSISWTCRPPPGKLCSSPAIADSSSKTGASAVVNRKNVTVRSSEQIFSTGSKPTSRNKGSSYKTYIAVRKAHGRAPPGSKTVQDSCATGTMSVGADKTSTEASPFKAKGQKAYQNGSRTADSSCLEKWSQQPAVTVRKKDNRGKREKRRKPRSKTSSVPSDCGVSKDTVDCKGYPTPPRSTVGACNSTASMSENKEPHCFLPQRAAATDVGIESKQSPRASATQRADCEHNSINRTDSRKEAAPQRADDTRTENMEISRSVATQSANDVTASRTEDEESLRPSAAQTDSAWTTRHKVALSPAATRRAHNANELENREVLRPAATQIADNDSRADNNLNNEDLAPAATQRVDNARRKEIKEVLRLPATQRADNASQTENKKVLRLDPTQRADNASRTKTKEAPKPAAIQRVDIFDQTTNREAVRAASAHGSWNAGGGTCSAIRSQGGMSNRICSVESLRPASSAVPCIKRREIRHGAVERKSVIAFNKKKKRGVPAAALITQQRLSSGNGTGDVQNSGGTGSPQLEFSYQGKPETVTASAELMKDQVLVSNNGAARENRCKYSASSKSKLEVITQIHAKCGESKLEYVAEILQCTDVGEALSAPRSVIKTGTENDGEIPGKDIVVPSPELDTETERDGVFVQSLECQDLNPQKCLTNLQTVPLARRRQASVSTRMRGNSRLRSSSYRKSQEEQDSKTEFQGGIKKVKSGTLVLVDDEQVKTVNGGKQLTDLGTSCMVEITDERGMSGACESGEIADQVKAPKTAVCNRKQQGEGIEQNDFAGSHQRNAAKGQQIAAKGSGRGFFHTQSALEPVDNEKKSAGSSENTTVVKADVSMEETVFFTTPSPSPTPVDEASEKGDVRGGSFESEGTSDKKQVADGVAASAKAQTKQNKGGKLVISHGCAAIMKRPSPLMSVQTRPTLGLWEQLHCQHNQPFFAVHHIEPSASSDRSIRLPNRPDATSLSESFKDPEVTSECTSESDCSKDTAETHFPGSPVSKNYQVSKCPSSQDPQKSEASKDCHILKCHPSQDLQKLETSKQSQFLGSPHSQEEEHHALEGVSSVLQPSQVIHKTAEKNMLEWEDRDLELTAVQSVPPEAEQSVPPEAEQSVHAESVSLRARLEGTAAGLAGQKLPVEPTQIQLEWVDRWRTAWGWGTGSNGEDSGRTGAGGISVGESSKSDSLLPLLLECASQGMKDIDSKIQELSTDTGTYNSDEPDLNLSDSVGLSPPLSFSYKEPRAGVVHFPETESISQTADFSQRFSKKSEAKNQHSQVESTSHLQAPEKRVSIRHRHSDDPRQNRWKESNGVGQFTLLKRENCKEQRPLVKRRSLCGSAATASRHHCASKSNDSDCLKLVHFHSQSGSGQNGRETLPLLATGEQHCREPVNSQKITGNISGELAIPHVASDQTCMAHVFSQGASGETGRKSVSSQAVLKDIRKMPHTGTGSKSQPAAGCSQSHRDAACDHGVDCSHGCVARERLHSLTDSDLYPRVQTSSSSDCGSDLLSQSDCDDLAAQVQGNCRTEVMQERQPYMHYLHSCEFSEYWHKVYSGAYPNLSWYPPYTVESSNQSYYSPHPSGSGDCWMQPHDPYYERWYNAWLAYSMACYGYGFQGQEQGMGCNDEHECQDGCCSTAFQQLQQNRPSSRPASRPPSAMENPIQQDLNPMPRERSPIYPDNSATLHQDVSGNGSMDGADDSEAIHIPCHSIQTVNSARHPLDYVHKQTVEASSIPDVSFELIVRMKNESQAASGSPVHEKTIQGSDLLETKDDVKTSSLQPDSHASPTTLADEDYRPIVQPPESSLHAMHPLWRFGARLPPPSRFPFGLNQPSCAADYCWPPRPQLPCPLVPAPLDPNPFCPLPTYPACRPRSATVTSSNSGNEEVKDGACGDGYSNLRQWPYSEWKEMPHYPDPSRFFHITQSSHLTPPTAAGSHPSFPETATSLGPETSSSEIGPMDSSFDQRGDYDASGSDLEEEEGGTAGGAEKRAQTESVFAHFVSAQKQRYLQMYKDSGSEDADSSSITSSQEPTAKHTSDVQGAISSASKYVIPNHRSGLGPGLSRYLEKRRIPSGGRGPHGRLCPPAAQVAPVMSSDCGEGAAAKKVACGTGVSTESPPTSEGGWWSKPAPPDGVLYDDHYPALPGNASPSLTPHFALGSYTKLPTRNAAPHQPPSFRTVKEDGTCKTFFRKKPFLALDTPFPVSSCGQKASSYASRLLKDSRVLGSSRWGKEAKEAFSRPYSSLFVDTHCHLDFLFNRQPYSGSFASYREKNKKTFPANFEGCVAVFCNPKSFTNESKWKPIVSEPRVWMAMGCHPKSALDYTEWAEMGLRQALKHKKTVALGEIGLDYSRHHGQYAAQQKEVFIRQIKMALEMQLPLVVHCREAEDDCLQILEEHVPVDYKIHCHCFTSNYDSALKWTSRFDNLFIGLTPLVTYRSAVDTHEVARLLPLDKLLLETDAPYFMPCGFDSEGISLSHPGLALMVAIKVAELRCMDVEEVLSQVRRNTHHMYNI